MWKALIATVIVTLMLVAVSSAGAQWVKGYSGGAKASKVSAPKFQPMPGPTTY